MRNKRKKEVEKENGVTNEANAHVYYTESYLSAKSGQKGGPGCQCLQKAPNGYAAHSVTAAEASPVFRDARLLLSVPFLIRAQE